MTIVLFFLAHWWLEVFFQSFFLHRYGAHRQLVMSKGWERFFFVCTYLVQGSSYLPPRGYAILHRMHHAYSDGPRDPHSPWHHRSVLAMMRATVVTFDDIQYGRVAPEPRFEGGYPSFPLLDRIGSLVPVRIAWGVLYTLFYARFATHAWMWALLPFHFVMSPVHAAIVNWFGHKHGYRTHPTADRSTNSLPIDVITLGELLQNNHHRHASRPNFAARRFEIDLTYQVIRVFVALGIVRPAKNAVGATALSS